ncbi:sensor histidine kinase [Minwuia sp.]|uniref:sensor histidine kinase n=1 Tax=Minwuia sp. TaxID=2493630 RepID=UPI003A9232E4
MRAPAPDDPDLIEPHDPWLVGIKRRMVENYGVVGSSAITSILIMFVSIGVSLIVYEIIDLNYWAEPIAIIMPIVLPLLTAFPVTLIIHRLVEGLIEREEINRRQREKLQELADEASRQRQAAVAASQAKSALLANMSHELRTPLNAIIGFSDVFQGDMLDRLSREQVRQYAADINISGRHLLSLVNDLLELARIERGSRDFHPEPIAFSEKVDEVCRIMRTQADEARVTITVTENDPKVIAMTDDRALRQILLNLLSNAIKFTPAKGRITITIAESAAGPSISIADTGIGIPADQRERIFEPFSQIDNSFTRRKTGTGLGLALVKTMVEQQDGRVSVESTEGQGTTFTLTFPAPGTPADQLAAE